MKPSSNDKIDRFIDDLQSVAPDKLLIVELIRQIFLSANKDLAEDIKYGGLVFNLSNELIAGIFPYKNHISIEFSNGINLPDPDGILEGKGKNRRHLKIIDKQDLDTKSVQAFVIATVTTNLK